MPAVNLPPTRLLCCCHDLCREECAFNVPHRQGSESISLIKIADQDQDSTDLRGREALQNTVFLNNPVNEQRTSPSGSRQKQVRVDSTSLTPSRFDNEDDNDGILSIGISHSSHAEACTPPDGPIEGRSRQVAPTPEVPAAPSKLHSHGSVTSRHRSAGVASAARSLTPLFNNFTPAVNRASQLGGCFVTLKAQRASVVRMHRQDSYVACPGDGQVEKRSYVKKRLLSTASKEMHASSVSSMSVRTAPQVYEQRTRKHPRI